MNKLCTTLVFLFSYALISYAAAADLKFELMAKEKASWTAWGNNDAATYGSFMDRDYWAVSGNAAPIVGKEKNVKALSENTCDLKNFSFGDFSLSELGPDAAVVAYTATVDSVCKGKPQVEKVAVTSVWRRTSGDWLNSHYHESKIE